MLCSPSSKPNAPAFASLAWLADPANLVADANAEDYNDEMGEEC
eukprot:CAMPEP_0184522764 /NCGR_PEP_ID=MMETSP0198_2-20121128/8469_1 /TAXON_ID=1112570 /ORGANISM="Thraustochytrium sp., Strain LLF1b" /LENGTH=43 /DNA_ID= /DNA_START= /DNA_END= /DNA_ORIENTATION=